MSTVSLIVSTNLWHSPTHLLTILLSRCFLCELVLLFLISQPYVIFQVGYGHIAPATTTGRLFCILYSLIGIPLLLVFMSQVGLYLYLYFQSCLDLCICNRICICHPFLFHLQGICICWYLPLLTHDWLTLPNLSIVFTFVSIFVLTFPLLMLPLLFMSQVGLYLYLRLDLCISHCLCHIPPCFHVLGH